MNQVALVGRVTKDPIVRRLSEGRMQANSILAVSRNFKNSKGEIETDFIVCTFWGKTAENLAKHCGKGSLVGVAGRIQSRSYEREDGSRVYVTEVIVEELRFLATKQRSDDNIYGELETKQTSAKTQFELPNQSTTELPIF